MHEKRTLDAEFEDLAETLAQVADPSEILEFLTGILTPREKENIALRWKLVKLLESGLQQRAISEELGVSLCKITRGSRELKSGPPGFREVVKRSVGRQRS